MKKKKLGDAVPEDKEEKKMSTKTKVLGVLVLVLSYLIITKDKKGVITQSVLNSSTNTTRNVIFEFDYKKQTVTVKDKTNTTYNFTDIALAPLSTSAVLGDSEGYKLSRDAKSPTIITLSFIRVREAFASYTIDTQKQVITKTK